MAGARLGAMMREGLLLLPAASNGDFNLRRDAEAARETEGEGPRGERRCEEEELSGVVTF